MLQFYEYASSIAAVFRSHRLEVTTELTPLFPRVPTSRQILGRAWVGSWREPVVEEDEAETASCDANPGAHVWLPGEYYVGLWPLAHTGQLHLWLGCITATVIMCSCYLPTHEAQHGNIARPNTSFQ
jgi:hypothetical protein